MGSQSPEMLRCSRRFHVQLVSLDTFLSANWTFTESKWYSDVGTPPLIMQVEKSQQQGEARIQELPMTRSPESAVCTESQHNNVWLV